MKLTTILYDLDGTLLPMDNDSFTKGYFKLLAAAMAPRGYEPKPLVDAVWAGMAAMVKNDGSQTNETAFWQAFAALLGEGALKDRPLFQRFYETDFQKARALCGFNPAAAETVRALKALPLRAALATNPIFPSVATESRIRWAGLEPDEFELFTTYENTCFCKPNPDYYRDVAARLGVAPEECLMVGNDATEDWAAQEAGMRFYLLTDCLLNKSGRDVQSVPHGGFEGLAAHVRALMEE